MITIFHPNQKEGFHMKKIANFILLLVVALNWLAQESQSCSNRGPTVKKSPPSPPPWFGISSFGRIIDNNCACGNSTLESEKLVRIAFGENVTYHSVDNVRYPWLVYIKVKIGKDNDYRRITESDGSYDCSGTLINDRMILTSAECVYQYDPAKNHLDINPNMKKISPLQLTVCMMMPDRSKFDSCDSYEIKYIITHPDFPFKTKPSDEKLTDNDIALLQLKYPINFAEDAGTHPICMHESAIPILDNNQNNDPDDERRTAIGWVPKDNKLKSYEFSPTQCPEEDNVEFPLDLRNYFCSTEKFEPLSEYPIMNYGSPVIGVLTDGNLRAYQYGILSWVMRIFIRRGTFHRRLTKYRLFTNIYRPDILSFIDYHSHKANAHWCRGSVDMSTHSPLKTSGRSKPNYILAKLKIAKESHNL